MQSFYNSGVWKIQFYYVILDGKVQKNLRNVSGQSGHTDYYGTDTLHWSV